jgi:DtxR family transcriptional regulator, Mn-dependent transcriptional regulator
MTPGPAGRSGEFRVEVDEHGARQVRDVMIGSSWRAAQPVADVEDDRLLRAVRFGQHGREVLRGYEGSAECRHPHILHGMVSALRRVARIGWGLDERAQRVNELIDTTEMYLRTIYELEEEGVVPLRARIAERLGQSGPTVSQTVARMERDGLVVVAGDRHLELTNAGRSRAVAVMRKHRLAERLLVDVIGLEWELVHAEACRWEHVMSEAVERKLVKLLDHPTTSPYGNPIPGLDELSREPDTAPSSTVSAPPVLEVGLQRLDEFARRGGGRVEVRRIAEHVQVDAELMSELKLAGIVPGHDVHVHAISRFGDAVPVASDGSEASVAPLIAHAVLVRAR